MMHEDRHTEIKKLLPSPVIKFTLLKLGYNKNKSFYYRGIGRDLSLTTRGEKKQDKIQDIQQIFLKRIKFHN